MQVKHQHPPFQGQEQYKQELHHAFAACVKKLRQVEACAPNRAVPGKVR